MKTKNRFISFLMAASIAASLCTPAWATMDVTTSADGIAGENKDITVGVSGVDASDDVVYGTTIVWEDPTFTYNVDGGVSTRWDPETHTYKAGSGAIDGAFDKNSVDIRVYNHSNAKIEASCYVGSSAAATETSYKVAGYDVTLAVSNPDGNAATLPAPEPNSELDAVSTTFALGISGDGMNQYASDLIASASSGARLGTVVVVIGKHQEASTPTKPTPTVAPVLWQSYAWYILMPDKSGDAVKNISFYDWYEPTGEEDFSWDASAEQNGSVTGYKVGSNVIISGNGYGCIYLSENANEMFSIVNDSLQTINGLDVLNTSRVTSMEKMFNGLENVEQLDVSSWDTSNVTTMKEMFMRCQALTSLDVSEWDVSNVTDMSYTFYYCKSLPSIDVHKWNTEGVTSFWATFGSCEALTSLDVSHFNTSNVTNMTIMFVDCKNLKNIDVSKFDTKNVTSFNGMFSGCSSLTSLNVTGFDTSSLIDLCGFVSRCTSLETLDLSSFETSKVKYMGDMFSYCSNLKTVYVSDKWSTKSVTSSNKMFYKCSNLVGAIDYRSYKTTAEYANYTTGYFTYKAA